MTSTNPTSGERVSDGRIATIRLAHRQRCFLDGANAELRQHCADIASICDEVIEHRRQSQGAGLTDEQRKAIEWAATVAEDCARDVATWPNAPTVSDSAKRAAILRALSHPQPSQACDNLSPDNLTSTVCTRCGHTVLEHYAQPSQGTWQPGHDGGTFCSQCGVRFEPGVVPVAHECSAQPSPRPICKCGHVPERHHYFVEATGKHTACSECPHGECEQFEPTQPSQGECET